MIFDHQKQGHNLIGHRFPPILHATIEDAQDDLHAEFGQTKAGTRIIEAKGRVGFVRDPLQFEPRNCSPILKQFRLVQHQHTL